MFSNNFKISVRQLKRLVTLELLGKMCLVVPGIAVMSAGRYGGISILLGIGGACIYAVVLCYVARGMNGSCFQFMKKSWGNVGACFAYIIYLLLALISTSFSSRLLAEMLKNCLLPEIPISALLFIILLVCGYATTGKLEGRGRMSEVFYLIVLIPVFLMLCLALPDLKTEYLFEEQSANVTDILKGGYGVFAVFTELSGLLVIFSGIGERKKARGGVIRAILILFAGAMGLFIASLGSFGIGGMRALKWPGITLMSSVNVPGGFLERWDILFATLLVFGLMMNISAGLYYMVFLIKEMIGKEDVAVFLGEEDDGGKKPLGNEKGRIAKKNLERVSLCLIPSMILVFIASVFFQEYQQAFQWYLGLMKYFFLPVTGLFLLLLIVSKGKKSSRKVSSMIVFFCLPFLLSGCQTKELEERSFPLAVSMELENDQLSVTYALNQSAGGERDQKGGVGEENIFLKGKDFQEVEQLYYHRYDHYLDLGHLKAIVFGKNLIRNKERFTQLLDYLEEHEVVARNVLVFISEENPQEILKENGKSVPSIGLYLDQMYRNNPYLPQKNSVTIGEVLNYWHNKESTIEIPEIGKVDGNLEVLGEVELESK